MVFRKFKYFRNLENNIELAHVKANDIKASNDKAISELNTDLKILKERIDMVLRYQGSVSVSQSAVSGRKQRQRLETKRKQADLIRQRVFDKVTEFPDLNTIDLKKKIVDELLICSKATFYRYVNYLKSQSLLKTETETETRIRKKNKNRK